MMIGAGAFAWFLSFYLIEVPIAIYLMYKLTQYVRYDEKKAAAVTANANMQAQYHGAVNPDGPSIEMTQGNI